MRFAPLALALPLALSLSSCQKPAHAAEGQSAAAPAASATPAGVIDGETYQVFPPAAAGAPLRVLAKPGFKPNADYPHRLVLKGAAEGAEGAEVAGEIKGEALTFAAAPASGAQVAATADFSICNDQMCKLYRGVELSWVAP